MSTQQEPPGPGSLSPITLPFPREELDGTMIEISLRRGAPGDPPTFEGVFEISATDGSIEVLAPGAGEKGIYDAFLTQGEADAIQPHPDPGKAKWIARAPTEA